MKNEIEIARNLGFEDIPTRKDLYEEIERLKTENAELKERLGNVVELDAIIKLLENEEKRYDNKLYSGELDGNEDERFFRIHYSASRDAVNYCIRLIKAEARLKELTEEVWNTKKQTYSNTVTLTF